MRGAGRVREKLIATKNMYVLFTEVAVFLGIRSFGVCSCNIGSASKGFFVSLRFTDVDPPVTDKLLYCGD